MTPAVALSKAGQSAAYTVFQDQREVSAFKASLESIAAGTCSGMVEKEGPGVAEGHFRGADVGVSERYGLRSGKPTDAAGDRRSGQEDILSEMKKRRELLADTILKLSPKYLDATSEEALITDMFDMGKIMNDCTGTYGDSQLSELVTRITAGPVNIPATPRGEQCDEAGCECLLRQYRIMKDRVKARHAVSRSGCPLTPTPMFSLGALKTF